MRASFALPQRRTRDRIHLRRRRDLHGSVLSVVSGCERWTLNPPLVAPASVADIATAGGQPVIRLDYWSSLIVG